MSRKTTADDVRQVLLSAVADALDEGKQEARRKPGLTGVRAVATGAVLYTTGRAAMAGRRFYRERFGAGAQDDGDEPEEAEEHEPEARSDDDEYVDDEEYADDEEEYADEDDELDAADRPPVHGRGRDDDGSGDSDLPPRPSRPRKAVRS